MLAVKGHYEHGRVELLESIEGIDEAEVIVVVSKALKRGTPVDEGSDKTDAFQMAGMETFFDNDEDVDVDWEEVFDVKDR